MRDLRQTENYSKYMQAIGWKSVLVDSSYLYIRKLPLLPVSIAKLQRPSKTISLDLLTKASSEHRSVVLYVEPLEKEQESYYRRCGFKLTKSALLPTKTVQINVKNSSDFLLSKMHYKTRYNIKLAKKIDVKVVRSKNIEKFADFWQKNALSRGMFLSLKREIIAIHTAFGSRATILSAFYKNSRVASILLVDTKYVSYYMYATATKEGKRVFAPTLLVWKALLLAKKRGRILFDFEGIYDERFPLKSWKGFTRFKNSFGGDEILYPGCFYRLNIPLSFR